VEWAGKPNSVRRACGGAIIYLGRRSPDGSCTLPAALERQARRGGPPLAAYLGLLAVGFTLPRPSPAARCALTAPFRPYRVGDETPNATTWHFFDASSPARRCRFCGTFPRLAPGWRYQPPCPAQFGLSSRTETVRAIAFAHSTRHSLPQCSCGRSYCPGRRPPALKAGTRGRTEAAAGLR